MDVNVNGINWKIIDVPGNFSELKRSDNVFVLGVTDNSMHRVYIASGLSNALYTKVLTHELCHVFCFSYDLCMDIQTEEIVADFVATYGRDIIDIADNVLSNLFFEQNKKAIF